VSASVPGNPRCASLSLSLRFPRSSLALSPPSLLYPSIFLLILRLPPLPRVPSDILYRPGFQPTLAFSSIGVSRMNHRANMLRIVATAIRFLDHRSLDTNQRDLVLFRSRLKQIKFVSYRSYRNETTEREILPQARLLGEQERNFVGTYFRIERCFLEYIVEASFFFPPFFSRVRVSFPTACRSFSRVTTNGRRDIGYIGDERESPQLGKDSSNQPLGRKKVIAP